jgi:hypothetical protein
MRQLIDRISQATGLAEDRAEKALGITLALIRSQGKADKVEALFAKLPGAAALADRHGATSSGLLGRLGGGLMGAPLLAVSQLQSAGLSMAQIKTLGGEVLDYAKEKAGDALVRDVAGSIPGLSSYV